jgi:hypothetical protein
VADGNSRPASHSCRKLYRLERYRFVSHSISPVIVWGEYRPDVWNFNKSGRFSFCVPRVMHQSAKQLAFGVQRRSIYLRARAAILITAQKI